MSSSKRYDQAYFDRWYRDPKSRVKYAGELMRKVRMAVAMAEYHLGRPLRSVLDVGCGEAAWFGPLRQLRPSVRYLGLDSSEYAVERYGLERNVRLARFGDLEHLRFDRGFDLIVCSDVMHYVPTAELVRGLSGFRELSEGVGFFEVFCKGDAYVGDTAGYMGRTAAWYRKTFARAGWTHCGNYFYLSPGLRAGASALEVGGG